SVRLYHRQGQRRSVWRASQCRRAPNRLERLFERRLRIALCCLLGRRTDDDLDAVFSSYALAVVAGVVMALQVKRAAASAVSGCQAGVDFSMGWLVTDALAKLISDA